MLEAFLGIPDGAHAPAPSPALDAFAAVHMVVKVERQNVRMRWLEHAPTDPPFLMVHLPLRGTVHARVEGGIERVCAVGQMLLDRRPHAWAHQNREEEGTFRNCWCQLSGSAVLAAADAAIAAHGPLVDLRSRPEVWRLVHDWFAAALRAPRADSGTLGALAFAWLARLGAWRSPTGIAAALALIENQFDDPDLDIARLARAAGCASSTFSRRFHAALGHAPYRYLRERRIDRAREFLLGGEPVGVIAKRCGYRDAAHFIHNFRGVTGESPHRYRRKRQP
jgi:AraC-like DNA-binding protein